MSENETPVKTQRERYQDELRDLAKTFRPVINVGNNFSSDNTAWPSAVVVEKYRWRDSHAYNSPPRETWKPVAAFVDIAVAVQSYGAMQSDRSIALLYKVDGQWVINFSGLRDEEPPVIY